MASVSESTASGTTSGSIALITYEEGSDSMTIDLCVCHSTFGIHKVMSRPPNEGVDKTVERMRMLFAPKPQKGMKGKRQTREDILSSCPPITFFSRDGKEVTIIVSEEEAPTNAQFWKEVGAIHIGGVPVVGDVEPSSFIVVPVTYNHPMILNLSPPAALYVGHDATCFGLESVFCSDANMEYQWFHNGEGDSLQVLCSRRVFTPLAEHVGVSIKCRVRPVVSNEPQAWFEVKGVPPVLAAPEAAIREGMLKRWALTRQSAYAKHCTKRSREEGPTYDDAIRVVSYNILNDAFATTNWAKRVLYPFASDEVRSLGFRQGAILNELRNYQGDLLCLQEVGESLYKKYLGPMLTESNYGHYYAAKSGMVKDGCAIAFSTSRFECLSSLKLPLTLTTLRANHPELSDEIHEQFPHLEYDLSKVVSVGAYVVLKDFGGEYSRADDAPPRSASAKPVRYLIVGNTHLFYKPHGCHIRAIQALMHATVLHREYEKLTAQLLKEGSSASVHLVCTGDFNLTSISGGYKLMTTGAIPHHNDCWDKGNRFWWCMDDEDETEDEGGSNLPADSSSASTPLPSTPQQPTSTATATGELVPPVGPPTNIFRKDIALPGGLSFVDTHHNTGTLFTNYSLTFKAAIDHIFVASPTKGNADEQEEAMVPVCIVPLPSEPELQADVAIPSSTFPSDHLAIIADVGFKRRH